MFPPNLSVVNAVNPLNIPSGRPLSWFPNRLMLVRPVIPEKSPDFRDVMLLLRKLSDVIAASCVFVTFAASDTPGTAATIVSRTSAVRSDTAVTCALLVRCEPRIDNKRKTTIREGL